MKPQTKYGHLCYLVALLFLICSSSNVPAQTHEAKHTDKTRHTETEPGVGDKRVKDLIKQLGSADPNDRISACMALESMGPAAKPAIPALRQTLRDKDVTVRILAASTLGGLGPAAATAVPDLVAALQDKNEYVRVFAATALGNMGSHAHSASQALRDVLTDPNLLARSQAEWALQQIGVQNQTAQEKEITQTRSAAVKSSGVGEPAALKECRSQVDRLDKEITGIEKDLAALKERINKRGKKIVKYQHVNNTWGKPIDNIRKEIRVLKKELDDRIRKAGGRIGTGQDTKLDKIAQTLMGTDKRAMALQEKIAKKTREEKDLIRKAEKAIEKEFNQLLDFDDWRIDLTALTEKQARDKDSKRNKEVKLASKKDDLVRKRKECQALAKSIQKPDTGQTVSDKEVVTFIGGIQIPTPKSGMDLPIEDEVEPNLEDTWEYFPLMQILSKNQRTRTYYKALKEDFKMFLPGVKVPSDPSLFSRSGAEFATLFEDSKNAGWKNTPIRPYHGAYLVFVDCARHYRFRLHVVRPKVRSTYGGIHLFGLQTGRHPVRVIIATEDGQRFEANFALVVKHVPEKRSSLEMGSDGIIREKPNAIVVDLNYLKKIFRKLWEDHLRDRSQAQAKGNRDVLRATLESDVHLVYHYVEDMKNQPGCTVDDVDPLLVKGGGCCNPPSHPIRGRHQRSCPLERNAQVWQAL